MKKINFLFSLILSGISLVLNAQPYIYFDPGTCEETLAQNSTVVVHSVLHNFTEDTVEFYFPGYTSRDLGGPDSYGYSWIDSDEPGGPDWAWTDISENGILIEGLGDDLVAGPYEMDINFKFYGETSTQFWISSNGCISFNDQEIPYANDSIPTNSDFTEFVAWFWDDLTIDTALTSVYFKNFDEKTIVQFNKMVHYPGTESFITAQVVFINNGNILIRYKQISEDFVTNSATIGLQSWDSELGLQVAYNEEYLHPEMAIKFVLNRNFITNVTPSSLYLPPNTQETIWITYDSEGFESGSYDQDLICVTNFGEYPHILLHNIMHVTNPNQSGFKGYVTDAATGLGINDVMVKVGEHQTYTNDNGYYELALEHGEYNVKFMRNGYQTLIVEDTIAMPGFSILDVELEGFYFMAGQVFADENHIESGFAYWYKMVEETVVDIDAKLIGEQGWFEFGGLSAAHYIVKAEPSPTSMYYGDYLPTYYGDVIHWEDATLIHLTESTDDLHIHLVGAVSAPQGPGSISGSIENADRAADIPVFLRTAEQETVVMTLSSAEGTYNFTDLAYGTYEIFAEVPGKSITPQTIILSETSPSVEGIDMVIMESEIIFTLGIAESAVFESVPVIYPNPVSDRASIMISLKKLSSLNIMIIDPAGRVISKEVCNVIGKMTIPVDLTRLSKGIYIMKMEAGGEVFIGRLFKN